ncbi:multidrug resistance-associated protein 1-like isoform X1 [Scaptodrosophila lebanonensis]|uniref:ABC-type glutathione-S-conjugate transporter n=1 Tax=Drosophila lebanonensis TaxID=7225 RepID=A0A6J2T2H5_DROLE|nr:multidrug resistance-associated protein 1-like isoform X1 [Scaptodrosophila lebanonensis]XP_030369097.1 multidrug resistance-associated protein 1-like isoform X1 [Scaptodrosophila lebanonensis]XP_030369105.1 multidrug resistance-associated protein 1-like isoform X1 [Scaptodrosophila lebanonensis]
MDQFCGSKFWNETWWTTDPQFTTCFEKTALVWAPCAFLWTFIIFDFYYLKASFDKDIPWNKLNLSKLVINLGLLAITALDLIIALVKKGDESAAEIYLVDIWSPIIKFATFLLAFIFIPLNRKYGVQTSGCHFLFWFLLSVCSIPRCFSELQADRNRRSDVEDFSWENYQYCSFFFFFASSCAMLLLNCFADSMPRQTKYKRGKNEMPQLSASFLSRITYYWFDALSYKGFRKPLEEGDLWDLRPQDSSKEVMPPFAHNWNKYVLKNKKDSLTWEPKAQFSNDNVSFVNPHGGRNRDKKVMASIIPVIFKSFGGAFLFSSFLKLIADILTLAQPQVLSLIIGFVGDFEKEQQPQWKGITYAVLLFVLASIQTLIVSQYHDRVIMIGHRTRIALTNGIYRKALRISNATRKECTVGEIVNLMAVDAQRFVELTYYVNILWSAPIKISLVLYFLWQLLGPSVLAGLTVLILLIPVNGFIVNRLKMYQIRQMRYKDERVKLMNEILSGIKVLKLYAWEPSFEKQVLNIREKEITTLKSSAYLNASSLFIWSCANFLVSLVTFGTYVLIDENNVLDATKTFVSLSLFNILNFELTVLPILIPTLVQIYVSATRVNKFLNSEELDPNNVQHDASKPHPMTIENASFSWDDDNETLTNINIVVPRNNLVAIVGTVGSGKSSVIQAFLGEMEKLSGSVNTVGKLAYVPQQAWIQNATLRDNILFGQPYDRRRYNRVIEACALRADIDILSAGDLTEIGEKGINLSGGQKQRISLARAVYSNADLYLLDDPLSAVDSHVGKHIFEEVIGPKGMLANKTRVLVTHGITFLPQVDNIYVMKLGEISESGTYTELLQNRGAFAEFLIQHLQEGEKEYEDLDKIQRQLSSTISEPGLLQTIEKIIDVARSESLSDSISLYSNDSLMGGLQNRISRQQSRESKISAYSLRKKEEEVEGKLIESEKSQTGNVDLAVYRHYVKSIGKFMAISMLALNLVFQAFQVGSSLWLTKWANDDDVSNDTSKRDMYLGVYGAFGFCIVVTNFGSALAYSLGCLKCSRTLHNTLLHYNLRWPMELFDTTPLGRIVNRFSNDIDVIDNSLPQNIRGVLSQAIMVLATLSVISLATPVFLIVIVPIAILYYFTQRFYVPTSRQLKRLESVSRSPIYSHFSESITGVSTIRAYSVEERFIDESDSRVDKNHTCRYPAIISKRWLAVRLEMIGNMIILFTSLFAVLGGQTNPALVGLSVSYAMQVTQTLNWLVRMMSDIETNIVSVERIKEYGESKQEAAWELEKDKSMSKNWPEEGCVSFENLKVRYREGLDLVLHGVTFHVGGGEKIGIVGRTGSGKSSLMLSMFRIIEASEGRILIDGTDIASLGLHMLRSRLSIIPQDPVLFSGSLRINLDPFGVKSDDEIWKALELSHLKSFVKGFPAGLNHSIVEGGENLSVGQRQLVCLARALLRKTKVLVLDEATAAVDLETDDLIQKTIRSEFKECTVLTIAHRLNTILDSDKIIVLDKGTVKEFSSPTELLDNPKSNFYRMARDAKLV